MEKSAKPTKAQTAAAKRREQFHKSVLRALTTKPLAMREIAAKLNLADAGGAVKPSNAAKIRTVLKVFIAEKLVERVGDSLKTTAYRKIKAS
jgi:hypothetical protein